MENRELICFMSVIILLYWTGKIGCEISSKDLLMPVTSWRDWIGRRDVWKIEN